ncbi:lysE type translocator family protein, partial [Vibrio cholerae HE-40]
GWPNTYTAQDNMGQPCCSA